ncbi:hypothetical protein [Pseudomonas guariconensis]|uniref:hypothetical protein n=1 Tax=Pseudomonas guariconensis TaxID=1288410 RepID=UPI0018AC6728|nr:hypothetical protein [Pseudomonas guariconensis]MBF8753594.1 hypothetical protein [Pseudomonas guariconensis]
MFFSLPTHIWVLPVAAVIAFFGLKLAEASERTNVLRLATYTVLVLLAVVPNGIHAVFAPAPVLTGETLLPNYEGLFYLDAFFVFAGWAISGVIRTRT